MKSIIILAAVIIALMAVPPTLLCIDSIINNIDFSQVDNSPLAYFSEDQSEWLSYIKEHLTKNLAISEEDFEVMPVFDRHGGLGRVKQVFGNDLDNLIHEINTAIAA